MFYVFSVVFVIIAVVAAIVIGIVLFISNKTDTYSDCCYRANNQYAKKVLVALETSALLNKTSSNYSEVLQSKINSAIIESDETFSYNLKSTIKYVDLGKQSENYQKEVKEYQDYATKFASSMKKLKSTLDKSTICYKKVDENSGLIDTKPVLNEIKRVIDPVSQTINGFEQRLTNLQTSWTNYNKSINRGTEQAKQIIEQNVKSFQDLFGELKNRVTESNKRTEITRDFGLIDVAVYLCQTLCLIVLICSILRVVAYFLNHQYDPVHPIPNWLQVLALFLTVTSVVITSVFFATMLLTEDSKSTTDCPAHSKNALLSSFSMRHTDFKTTERQYDSICKSSDDSILSNINIEQYFSENSVLRTLDLRTYKSQMTSMVRYGGIIKLQIDKEFTKQLKTFNSLIEFLGSLLEESCLDANQKNEMSQHKEKFEIFVNSSKTFETDISKYNERIQDPEKVTNIIFENARKSIDSEIEIAVTGTRSDLNSSDLRCEEIMKFKSECSYSVDRSMIPGLVIWLFFASLASIIFQTIPAPLTKTEEEDRKKKELLKAQRKMERKLERKKNDDMEAAGFSKNFQQPLNPAIKKEGDPTVTPIPLETPKLSPTPSETPKTPKSKKRRNHLRKTSESTMTSSFSVTESKNDNAAWKFFSRNPGFNKMSIKQLQESLATTKMVREKLEKNEREKDGEKEKKEKNMKSEKEEKKMEKENEKKKEDATQTEEEKEKKEEEKKMENEKEKKKEEEKAESKTTNKNP